MAKQRDITIDFIKALCIISVPFLHAAPIYFSPAGTPETTTSFVAHLFQGILIGFCIPTFIFFSGWFHHDAPWFPFLKKNAHALLCPYFVTAFVVVLMLLAFGHPDLVGHKLLGILSVNGSEVGDPAVRWYRWAGPIWFLPVLFWCRVIHKALYGRLPGYLALAIGFGWLALAAGHWIPNYNFGLLTAVGCVGYYSLGFFCHEKRLNEHLGSFFKSGLWMPAFLLCAYSMSHFVLDISTFRFEPYPVTFLTSVFSIAFLYLILSHVPRFLHPVMNWVGQNTLLILCYHTLALMVVWKIHLSTPLWNPIWHILIYTVLTFMLPYIHISIRRFLHHAA